MTHTETAINTNRRVGRYLPRMREITKITDHELKQLCDHLDNTPRKCFGRKTPAEVYREMMMEEIGRRPYPRGK